MLLLAIDTAGPDCAAALARGEAGELTFLAQLSERIGRGHAERLMPMIGEVLPEAGLSYRDLDRIVVTTGPGSFTGVRIGVAAARALALALDRPAIGIGSLHALAAPALWDGSEGIAIAALDAKRGEIYAFAQDIGSGNVLLDVCARTPQAVAEVLRGAAPPLILTGSGAALLADALGDRFSGQGAMRIVSTADSPDIADIARLGLAAQPGRLPTPLYARGADAKPQAHRAVARAS